jgi:hypothetical protein
MFEPPPEKPSHFALYWIALIALAGGIVGVLGGLFLFGEERFQTNAIMFGSFFLGAIVAAAVGWKLVMPSRPPS